jgi:hypothetical protein
METVIRIVGIHKATTVQSDSARPRTIHLTDSSSASDVTERSHHVRDGHGANVG